MPNVIMSIGTAASGKTTTMIEVALKLGYCYLSADDIRENLTGDSANHEHEGEVWNVLYSHIANALCVGESIVIDITNSKHSKRTNLIKYCRDSGATLIAGIHFTTPLEQCLRWNKLRDRIVPEHLIKQMFSNITCDSDIIPIGFDVFGSYNPVSRTFILHNTP